MSVTLVDSVGVQLEKARKEISRSLAKFVEKGKLTAQASDATLGRIALRDTCGEAPAFDAAIEAVSERIDVKRAVFAKMDQVVRDGGIIASNTSSIPITRLAASTRRPDAVIGIHFMNPVPLMALVELIRGAATSDATTAHARALADRMGKTTVLSKDFPGFIVNRILIPMLNEACFALSEGIATAEDIDTAMKLGTNQPMGPLTLADLIGLDTVLAIAEVLHQGFGEDKYRPAPLLRQYVEAGWLGRKTGRGFHHYSA